MQLSKLLKALFNLFSPGGPSPGDLFLLEENKRLRVEIIKLDLEVASLRGRIEINEKLKNLNSSNIHDFISSKVRKP